MGIPASTNRTKKNRKVTEKLSKNVNKSCGIILNDAPSLVFALKVLVLQYEIAH